MRQLNYQALDRHISFRERLSTGTGKGGVVTVLAGILIVCITASISYGAQVAGPVSAGLIFGGIIVIFGVGLLSQAAKMLRLGEFAAQNGMEYHGNAPYDNRAGIIFQPGHAKIFSDLLVAHSQDFAEIGNYRYTVGSGKNQRTYDFGFVRLKLPRRLPNMLLDSRKNNFLGGRLSNLNVSFPAEQRLSLEGDFDQYFSLYVPKEYEADALYVFTPDVMQALINTVGWYDCEVIDDDFYIYSDTPFTLTDKRPIEGLLAIAHMLRPELATQTDYYADTRVGDRALNVVAAEGARLKTRMSLLSKIVLLLALAYFAWQFWLFVSAALR